MAARWLYAWGLGSVAFGGASLLVPLHVVKLGGSTVDLGVLAASAAVIGAPGAIIFGRLADRVGHRRTLVLTTLAIVSISLALIPFLASVPAVIVANAGLWLVVASVAPVLTMLVVNDAPASAWGERIGQLNKFQGYGWAGGLVVGSVWPLIARTYLPLELVTDTLFWLLAASAGTAAVLGSRSLPRPALEEGVPSERAANRIARLMAVSGRTGIKGATFVFSPNRLYWTTRGLHPRQLARRLETTVSIYLLAAGLFFAGFAAFWAPLPLFFTASGFNAGQIFGLYLVSSLGSAVLYEGAGRLAARYDLRWLQAGTLVGRAILFPAVALVTGLGAIATGYVATGIVLGAIGLTWAVIAVVGTAIVSRLAPASVRGEVLGMHTAIAAIAGGIGGMVGGWAATFSYLAAFGVAGGLVVLGAALVASIAVLSDSPAGEVHDSGRAGVSDDDLPTSSS